MRYTSLIEYPTIQTKDPELLETVSTLLEIKSDSALILDLALRPLTLEGLRTVAAWTIITAKILG